MYGSESQRQLCSQTCLCPTALTTTIWNMSTKSILIISNFRSPEISKEKEMVRACSPCSQPKWFLRPFGLQHRSRIYKAHSLFYNPVQKTLSSLHGAEVYLQQRMKIMANKQKLSTYKQTLPVRGRGKPELNWTCHKFMVLPLSIQSTLQKHITLLQISTFFAV